MVERIVPGTPEWDVMYSEHIQRYEFVAQYIPTGSRVLDAGCGVGYGAAHLADKGAVLVTAVDISSEAIRLGRQHFDRKQILWIQEDCHTLTEASRHGPYNVICILENIEHLSSPEMFLSRSADLLSPNGYLMLSTPNRSISDYLRVSESTQIPANPYHHREYTYTELIDLLRQYFRKITIWYQCYTLESEIRRSLEPILFALWSNPALRAGRWLQRRMRRHAVPASLQQLLPPVEWQIVANDPGCCKTWNFIAICQLPRER